jgi:uncharacterized protein YjbI with pentapeptide repeats
LGERAKMNTEHRAMLLRGADAWNQWRLENQDLPIDLSGFSVSDIKYDELNGKSSPWYCDLPSDGSASSSTTEDGCLDLSEYNLDFVNFYNADFGKSAKFVQASLNEANLEGCKAELADFSGATMLEANVKRANFKRAKFRETQAIALQGDSETVFERVDAEKSYFFFSDFDGANFEKAEMKNSDLDFANFSKCRMSQAILRGSSVVGSNFSAATMNLVNMREVGYDRALLLRQLASHWKGVNGLQTIEGDTAFKSILLDFDYNEGRLRSFQAEWPKFHQRFERRAAQSRYIAKRAVVTGLNKVRVWSQVYWYTSIAWISSIYAYFHVLLAGWLSVASLFGAAVGGLVFSILNPTEAASLIGTVRSTPIQWSSALSPNMGLVAYMVSGFLLFGSIASWYGRRVVFAIWASVFDYGRDWDRIAILAIFGIGCFGLIYANISSDDICVLRPGSQSECIAINDGTHWAYSYFVAALGFLTLGLQSNLVPKSGLGQLIVLANVLSGWLTFGLLLSVLQNQFARR